MGGRHRGKEDIEIYKGAWGRGEDGREVSHLWFLQVLVVELSGLLMLSLWQVYGTEAA